MKVQERIRRKMERIKARNEGNREGGRKDEWFNPRKVKTAYQKIGDVEVDGIKEWLDEMGDGVWTENTMRQENFKDHHGDTQSVIFVWSEDDGNGPEVMMDQERYDKFREVIKGLVEMIENYYGYENPVIYKMMLAKLKAGGVIKPHYDYQMLKLVHRIHVPIVTNEQVDFSIWDNGSGVEGHYHFCEGEVIEINNGRFHGVANEGMEDRIHLIIDFYYWGGGNLEGGFLRDSSED